jgi:SAM-dependent methyltransferase
VGTSADHIITLYERHALAFDQDRSRTLFERAWLDRFLALLPPHAAASVLDLGCGSGEPIERFLIEHGHAVTGIDSSPTLIGLCRARFPDHDWIVGDMRRLTLGRRFDGLLAWDSFFHLLREDQRGIFPVFRDHALPGAPLLFTSGPAKGEAIGCYRGEALFHASLDPAEYRALLDAHGFDVIRHVAEDPECGGHTVWLARRR